MAAADKGRWSRERTSGGADGPQGSGTEALIEVAGTARSVAGNGLGLGGIELGALVEVIGEGFLCDLVCLPTAGPHGELGLGGSLAGWRSWGEVGSPIWAIMGVMGPVSSGKGRGLAAAPLP